MSNSSNDDSAFEKKASKEGMPSALAWAAKNNKQVSPQATQRAALATNPTGKFSAPTSRGSGRKR